ncbi:MAG TPA: anthranilate phosphoribosyltransferase, partial [Hellea balneolensis]|nr:anthranilate phosphoribosyltransferase [Hellea balneolensis]
NAPDGAMDIVGTGGDGLKTYNISTAVCFVVAGAGGTVAKHGNRAVSSRSGASDVLRELGVKLDISTAQTEDCIAQAGVGFLFAPNHHPAMANVAKARAMLKSRTIFNCLGPLCNPAEVENILVGVYSNELRKNYAEALLKLGIKSALIVHGGDGMDEITTSTLTMVSEIMNGALREYEITPEQFGLPRAVLKDLEGGDPAHNAHALRNVLDGKSSAYRDIILLNSGAALYVNGCATNIEKGIDLAQKSIASGAATSALSKLVEISNA